MAVKQYIGARYVPLLDGDYDVNKTYEPLTTVNYGNATYTSKKKVPAGIVPTDSNYWMQTGFGNQQISTLIDWRNNTVDPFITSSSQTLVDLNDGVDDLDNRVTTNETDIGQIKQDVDEIESIISTTTQRNVILIGDSYADVGWSDWLSLLKTKLENNAHFNTVHALHRGGAGFNTSARVSFLSILEEVVGNLTTEEKNRITDVLVAGGYNDSSSSVERIMNGLTPFMTYAKTNLPNAKVHIACIGSSTMNDENTYAMTHLNNSVVPAYKKCAEYDGVYVSNSEYILRNAELMNANGNHPNAASGPVIANQLFTHLTGGVVDVYYSSMYQIKNGDTNLFRLLFIYHNGEFKIFRVDRDAITLSVNKSINTDSGGYFVIDIGSYQKVDGNYTPVMAGVPAVSMPAYNGFVGAGGSYRAACNIVLQFTANGVFRYVGQLAPAEQLTSGNAQISCILSVDYLSVF